MALSNDLKNIVLQIQTQLKNINGGTDYNNNVPDDYIQIGYKTYEEADGYPFISIASIGTGASRQTDQVTYETPVACELFCYVQAGSQVLETVMDLLSDVEKALYADGTLGGRVWGMSLTMEAVAMGDYGVGVVTVRATMQYTKS